MKLTISPARKYAFMILLVIVFLPTIHFWVLPTIQYLLNSSMPSVLRIFVAVFIVIFTFVAYTRVFRPLVPGQSSWRQQKFWSSLTIERSFSGWVKLMFSVGKVFVFSLSLYFMSWFMFSLYKESYREILNGTYVYDRFKTPFMIAPLVMVFLLFLYISVKVYDKFANRNET